MRIFLFSLTVFLFTALPLQAQELHQDLQEVVRGEVLAIVEESERVVPGTETKVVVQTLRIELLSGSEKGKIVEVENDLVPLAVGEKVYINHLSFIDGNELYGIRGIDRAFGIYFMLALFAAAIIAFGGWQGFRSLVSLAGSFLLITFVLFPLFLKGYDPLMVAVTIGSLVLLCAIGATHGISLRSLVAWVGSTLAIILTALAAVFGTDLLHLTGFFSDETVYLNLNSQGSLNIEGLLLASIIIGVLGVLDDVAVTQVAVIAELRAAAGALSRRELYQKGLRVGREHVSALVNTIVLAYAGVSLPLLLLFAQSGSSLIEILNNEIFATELVRTIAGSLGLIATVPITTALAAFFADRFSKDPRGDHHHLHT